MRLKVLMGDSLEAGGADGGCTGPKNAPVARRPGPRPPLTVFPPAHRSPAVGHDAQSRPSHPPILA
jgi:hypothetical protein